MSDSPAASVPPLARLVLLAGTHRVAPGLLSWPAWQTLREAAGTPTGCVLTADADHPQLPYLREAGVEVEPVDLAEGPRVIARRLLDRARTGLVVWLAATDDDPGLGPALAQVAAGGEDGEPIPEIELLPGAWDLPGARLLDLVAVMDRLRSPGGCPWDAKQTHESLARYLVEETYELVDAIDSGDRDHMREELGDVLMQVFFHARVAQEDEADPFTIDDVAGGIVEKLISRHPHVFADVEADTPEAVEANWDALKAAEKSGRESALDGIAMSQPALALAAKTLSRTHRAGLVVPVPALPVSLDPDDYTGPDAIGDLLLAITDLASRQGVDAETALRAAALRQGDRVRITEGPNE
ncbi:MazG family protein [Embleya sp. NBC_00896]|uniref:MazG family protein n=1 Tax=Embleya sp. NBC_00896 TaxID=2975961 RepID=UPI003868014C|nr:MazG family protein [Embleya sp. NBC_00896]